ncbi:MAG: DUF2382 domain-containing protein [Phormidesmis sp.]
MPLASLKKTYPDYRNTFSDNNLSHIEDYSVYADGDDKVGSVEDGLFDDTDGQFRYLIVDTGFWFFGKKVLLPVGRARFDNDQKRVYVAGLTKEQVESLPEYDSDMTVDYDYEENVRGVYRENSASQSTPVGTTAAVGATAAYDQDSYTYERDADLYTADVDDNHPIRLYEERLVADKNVIKTGDVVVGKRVETETASVSIPLEKERVVIERTAATTAVAETTPHAFNDGEVARVEVYEEQAAIRKETVMTEEVNVRKEKSQEMATEQATIRREELDVTSDGNAVIDKK